VIANQVIALIALCLGLSPQKFEQSTINHEP
jgi:hypothetical protein